MSDTEEVVVYEQGEGNDKAIVEQINERLNLELRDPKVVSALLATTFNGLDAIQAKQALMEGMIRGFAFEDFMKKHVYAIPYGGKYSLVTSIDHARTRGMRSGVIGVGAPEYTFEDDKKTKVETCTVTVKRLVQGHVGEYTATVYFSEYTTGKNLWATKPKTMIAKVAEMHALRKACPEELSQHYAEEEMQKEVQQPNRWQGAKDASKSLTMGSVKTNNATQSKNKKEANGTETQEGESDAAGDNQ